MTHFQQATTCNRSKNKISNCPTRVLMGGQLLCGVSVQKYLTFLAGQESGEQAICFAGRNWDPKTIFPIFHLNNLCAANHDFTPKEAYRVERKPTSRSEDHGPFFTSLLPPHVSNHDLHNNQIWNCLLQTMEGTCVQLAYVLVDSCTFVLGLKLTWSFFRILDWTIHGLFLCFFGVAWTSRFGNKVAILKNW